MLSFFRTKRNLDISSEINRGARDYQEDAVEYYIPDDRQSAVMVLADGLGGHAAGHVASSIVSDQVMQALKPDPTGTTDFQKNLRKKLKMAADVANDHVRLHMMENPETEGMGSTLLATVIISNYLYWISIGDSPLYLFRKGALTQLNQDHSMAPKLDALAKNGSLTVEAALNHPMRNSLLSVIVGDSFKHVDCPRKAFKLAKEDLLIAASDGLQFLSDREIEETLMQVNDESSKEIASALMEAVLHKKSPHQDNIAICVLRADECVNDASLRH
ncbi:MAG: serine/threonine-protein phosphatase [Proteobacteria bacterium]|nr:serine/threonine-protein phosphatase [Pseudomonadota bacterium]